MKQQRVGSRCIVAAMLLLLAAAAHGQGIGEHFPTGGDEAAPPEEGNNEASPETGPGPDPATTVIAKFQWSMPPRYEAGWQAWNTATSTYNPAYVRPNRWQVVLDACASTGAGSPIVEYKWSIVGSDGISFAATRSTVRCRTSFDNLPKLGRYVVQLDIKTAKDGAATSRQFITLRDWLIVALGDSMTSGEGNPDVPGEYEQQGSNLKACKGENIRTVTPAKWKDRRCHRSAFSGAAVAAQKIEQADPHSSVTFVSLACSGAGVNNLISQPYKGQEPSATEVQPLPAQIPAARRMVGDRKIDAVLLSVGINDIGFRELGDTTCASDHDQLEIDKEHACFNQGVMRTLDALGGGVLAGMRGWRAR